LATGMCAEFDGSWVGAVSRSSVCREVSSSGTWFWERVVWHVRADGVKVNAVAGKWGGYMRSTRKLEPAELFQCEQSVIYEKAASR